MVGFNLYYKLTKASLIVQLVKNPPAMWETWVLSLVGQIPWRWEWLPTPVFWPGEFHGPYSPRASLIAQLVKNPPAMKETLV